MAGSKPKSLAQQLFEAQQRRAAHKAALEKAAMQAEQKEKRAAARREEAAARQAQRAAEDLARRQQAADARQVRQVLREMEKRETLRQQAQAREEKDRAVQRLRDEAAGRTREVERRVQAIGSVLTDRDRGLEPLREDSNAALESGDAEAYADRIARLLEERSFLRRSHPQVAYSAQGRRLTVAVDLPRPEGVPAEKAFRYVAAQDEIVAVPRQESERRRIYRDAVARLALCVADYVAALTAPEMVDVIAVNGHVHGTDPATGQPGRPCLVTLVVTREDFEKVALDEPQLDPVRCLDHLRGLISKDPCVPEPVTPFIDLDGERDRDAASALDLAAMDPFDFERLIRDLFLAMGFRAWKTPDSRDGGVDAVAVRDDIAIGGVCVIQAKRYTGTVPVEAVRALYGTMQEKKAYTGLVVTTSSFGPASYAFAREVGRITLIDGGRLTALLRDHLGMDVVVKGRRTATS